MHLSLFFLLAASCQAGNLSGESIVPNPENGRIKAYTCTGCHGIPGWRNAYPSYRVPRIHGQHFEYLVSALTDYRSGARRHATMRAQGAALSDQDIADIAAYLAGGVPAAAATSTETRPAEEPASDSASEAETTTPTAR